MRTGEALDDASVLAEAYGYNDKKRLTWLLDSGADPSAPMRNRKCSTCSDFGNDKTPLVAYLAKAGSPQLELFQLLLERGAKVDAPIENDVWRGNTALITASSAGEAGLVELLLRYHANPNYVVPGNKHTALMSAAGFPQLVDLLLKAGAALEAADADGRTAVIFAGMAGCQTAVDHLKSKGANADRKDKNGKSATDYLKGFSKDAVPGGICSPDRSR